MKKRSIRWGAAVASVAAVTAVLGAAEPVSAATGGPGPLGTAPSTGHVLLCASGNYDVQLNFPDRGWSSGVASPGQRCVDTFLSGGYGGSDGYEPIEVFGHYNTSNNQFKIGSTLWFNATKQSLEVTAKGTTANAGQGASVDVTFLP